MARNCFAGAPFELLAQNAAELLASSFLGSLGLVDVSTPNAASVLGGTSILGGRASLSGAVLGVVLIRLLQNGLTLIGVPSLWQSVVTGALIIIAVAVGALIERR